MDNALAGAGISTTSIAVLYLLYKIVGTFCNHRYVSDCCGRRLELGVAVRDMAPSPQEKPKNQSPRLSPVPALELSVQSPPGVSSIPQEHLPAKDKDLTVPEHPSPQSVVVSTVPE